MKPSPARKEKGWSSLLRRFAGFALAGFLFAAGAARAGIRLPGKVMTAWGYEVMADPARTRIIGDQRQAAWQVGRQTGPEAGVEQKPSH